MSSSASDAELLEAIDLHRAVLLRFVEAMIGDAAAAEDLVQDAARIAFEKLGEFERRAKFSTWLYSIALNLARKYRRDRARRAKPAELDEQASPRRGALSSILRRETAEQIAPALERLPPSLHVRVHRARGLLRDQLGSVVDTAWVNNRSPNS